MKEILLLCAAAALIGILVVGTASSSHPAKKTATAPAAQSQLSYPPPSLIKATAKAAEALKARLDDSFKVITDPPFIAAGNVEPRELRQYMDSSIIKPARALWAGYFQARPDQPITVLLFKDDASYRLWAKKLFNDDDVSHFGYYRDEIKTLVMNISTGSGTLVHELTHALIVYDFPRLPDWFNEGFASLHECCTIGSDDITGWENWRLPALQKAIGGGALRSLKDMVTRRDFYGRQQGMNYAQARYLCLFMQRKGLLKDFYAFFREHHGRQGDDVKALEKVFRKDINAIEKDYLEFVKALKAP